MWFDQLWVFEHVPRRYLSEWEIETRDEILEAVISEA